MLLQLLPAFSIGLLATLSPCVLPLYPGFLAYLAANAEKLGQKKEVRWLGLCVLAGVLTMMLALGALIAFLRVAVGQVLALVTPISYLIVIVLGIAMMLGRNPFAALPQLQTPAGNQRPYLTAYLYGLLYGPIALPCSGPLVVSVFALSLGVNGFINQLLFFFIFGLGFGLPLLLLAFLAQSQQGWLLKQFSRHGDLIGRVGGLILVLVALWAIVSEFESFALYLGI